jgi:hypothetical protein
MSRLDATVGIRNGPFKNGLNEMKSQAKAWGSDIKSTIAGAFAFGAVASFFTNFVSSLARVKDLSDRLGESSQTIQRIGNAASLSGSDLEYVVKVMTKLGLSAADSADKFELVGIKAEEFAGASTEQKILMLAKAYEDAGDSQQKMMDLMNLLGPKGQDIMIMLASGVDGLKEAMDETATASNTAVNAIARLDDAIASSKATITSWAAGAVDAFEDVAMGIAAIWKAGGPGAEADKILNAARKARRDEAEESTGGRKLAGGLDLTDPKEAAKRDKQTAEAGAALDAELLKLTRSRMDAEAKITDLKREQAEHAAHAKDQGNDAETQRKAATKVLEIQQQIESGQAELEKKKQDEADKALKKKQDADKAAGQAEENLADEANKQRLAKLDPKARIAELKRQQKALNGAAARDPDAKSRAEKKLEALKMNGDIDAAQKELESKDKTSKPAVVSSSLASIGGGGRAYVGADPALTESRRQTSLLMQLVRNTTSQGGGGMASVSRNPF